MLKPSFHRFLRFHPELCRSSTPWWKPNSSIAVHQFPPRESFWYIDNSWLQLKLHRYRMSIDSTQQRYHPWQLFWKPSTWCNATAMEWLWQSRLGKWGMLRVETYLLFDVQTSWLKSWNAKCAKWTAGKGPSIPYATRTACISVSLLYACHHISPDWDCLLWKQLDIFSRKATCKRLQRDSNLHQTMTCADMEGRVASLFNELLWSSEMLLPICERQVTSQHVTSASFRETRRELPWPWWLAVLVWVST